MNYGKSTKKNKTHIVIFHGWGASFESFVEVKKMLQEKGYIVSVPDLPGFGKNKLTESALTFDNYISFAKKYIETITSKSHKIVVIGHSFGGRIAIRFASLYPKLLDGLILTGASGIPRPLPSLKKKIVYALTKVIRPIFLVPPFSFFYAFFRKAVYYSIGEMDYYKSGNLSETFKNVYKISIVDSLKKITVPTLIVWGLYDRVTPVVDGEYMHAHIKHSKFIIVPEAGHKLPYELPTEFLGRILPFLKSL